MCRAPAFESAHVRTLFWQGLSLGMYMMFVGGVLLWITYGILKRSPSLILSNVVTACLSGFILLQILAHTLLTPEPPPLPVAVCLVAERGMAPVFLSSKVIAGVREHLLQPNWRLVAAFDGVLGIEEARVRESLSASFDRLYVGGTFDDWQQPSDRARGNCSLPNASATAQLAFGVQHCIGLVEQAELIHNLTFAYVLRVRADLLWTAPLPSPAKTWHPAKILATIGGDDRLAIVPRAALRSYFNAFDLFLDDCPKLRHHSESPTAQSVPTAVHCDRPDAPPLRSCIFRVQPADDGIWTGHTFQSGAHVWVPHTAALCRKRREYDLASDSPTLRRVNATGAGSFMKLPPEAISTVEHPPPESRILAAEDKEATSNSTTKLLHSVPRQRSEKVVCVDLPDPPVATSTNVAAGVDEIEIEVARRMKAKQR